MVSRKTRPRSHARRSPAEWSVRLTLAAGAAWLGFGALTHSVAYMVRGSAVEQAHKLAPNDGRITALAAAKLSGPNATPANRKRGDDIARQALRQDATAVAAVTTLGINAQIRGETNRARLIFAYSRLLSRRDLQTGLWSIEDAVTRGNIAQALRNYDITLKTSRSASELLFPVLGSAIADGDVREGLVRTLATRPLWSADLITYLAVNGPDTHAIAALFLALDRAKIDISYDVRAMLLRRLVTQGAVEDAWAFYAASTPRARRNRSRDPDFVANLGSPSPFDWLPITNDAIETSIQRGQHGGIFDFSVSPNTAGPLLQQMQMLPQGRYVLEGRSAEIDQPEQSRPYWQLICTDGREIGRVPVPNSTQTNGRFHGTFDVPANCPAQYLTLTTRASDQDAGINGQITYALLHAADKST